MYTVSKPTIYGWFARWKENGIEGLAIKPRSGRPSKTDETYRQKLEEVIDKEPKELGYDFAVWTVERLRLHMEKETGISLSESRLRALIKRQGYRYRRPKYDLGHLQDKDAKARAEEVLEGLKKRSRRRFRAHLYGRNNADAGSAFASLLDEGWQTEACACH